MCDFTLKTLIYIIQRIFNETIIQNKVTNESLQMQIKDLTVPIEKNEINIQTELAQLFDRIKTIEVNSQIKMEELSEHIQTYFIAKKSEKKNFYHIFDLFNQFNSINDDNYIIDNPSSIFIDYRKDNKNIKKNINDILDKLKSSTSSIIENKKVIKNNSENTTSPDTDKTTIKSLLEKCHKNISEFLMEIELGQLTDCIETNKTIRKFELSKLFERIQSNIKEQNIELFIEIANFYQKFENTCGKRKLSIDDHNCSSDEKNNKKDSELFKPSTSIKKNRNDIIKGWFDIIPWFDGRFMEIFNYMPLFEIDISLEEFDYLYSSHPELEFIEKNAKIEQKNGIRNLSKKNFAQGKVHYLRAEQLFEKLFSQIIESENINLLSEVRIACAFVLVELSSCDALLGNYAVANESLSTMVSEKCGEFFFSHVYFFVFLLKLAESLFKKEKTFERFTKFVKKTVYLNYMEPTTTSIIYLLLPKFTKILVALRSRSKNNVVLDEIKQNLENITVTIEHALNFQYKEDKIKEIVVKKDFIVKVKLMTKIKQFICRINNIKSFEHFPEWKNREKAKKWLLSQVEGLLNRIIYSLDFDEHFNLLVNSPSKEENNKSRIYLVFLIYHCQKSVNLRNTINNCEKLAISLKNDQMKQFELGLVSYQLGICYEDDDLEKAEKYFTDAVNILKNIDESSLDVVIKTFIARAEYNVGCTQFKRNRYVESRDHFTLSIENYKQLINSDNELIYNIEDLYVKANLFIAIIELKQGNAKLSIDIMKKCIKHLDYNFDYDWKDTRCCIAAEYIKCGYPVKAIKLFLEYNNEFVKRYGYPCNINALYGIICASFDAIKRGLNIFPFFDSIETWLTKNMVNYDDLSNYTDEIMSTSDVCIDVHRLSLPLMEANLSYKEEYDITNWSLVIGPQYCGYRGYCVLINNISYYDEKDWRNGTLIDAMRLIKYFFAFLNYEVEVFNDMNEEELLFKLGNIASSDILRFYDTFVCVTLSHGDNGVINGMNSRVFTREIVDLFSNKNCPNLANKPKIFIFNCCRGTKPGESYINFVENSLSPELNNRQTSVKRDAEFDWRDVFIWYSTIEGFVSYRDGTKGSIFIDKLIAVLKYYGNKNTLMDLAKRVEFLLRAELSGEPYKQVTSIETFGFCRDFYFYRDNRSVKQLKIMEDL